MKSIQKITRVQLKNNYTEKFSLLGLVSSEPDYKLSLAINKKFRISLKNSSPVIVKDESGSEEAFSRFSFSDTSHGSVLNLISNRSGKHFLLKKLMNVDYIFLTYDADSENSDKFTGGLKEIDSISAVFKIDLDTFKDKNLKYLT